jgi:hypothetical protein
MNKPAYRDDAALVAALRNLYVSELQGATAEGRLHTRAAVVEPGSGGTAASRSLVMTAIAVGFLVLAILVFRPSPVGFPALGSTPGTATPVASTTPSSGPSSNPSIGPKSSPSIGPLLDGIPVTIDGEPVLRGAGNIAKRFEDLRYGDQAFLAGGWFHAGQPERFCPAYLTRTPWWSCSTFALYELPQGGAAVWIYPGDPLKVDPAVPTAADRAVVLRIHTHDASCPADFSDCVSLPVLVEVVWLGP